MSKLLLIGLAGLIGTLSRYWLSGADARRYGEAFPLGTLLVNLIGCFLVGLLFYLLQERFLVHQTVRTVVLIGFLGGFTTFSSYGLQTFTRLQDGEFGLAALNLIASNLIGLFLVWAGYTLAKAFCATVIRGVMGFGKHSVIHTAKILRLSEDLPMIIEIADSLERIEQFPVLDEMITDGLVTLERVRVIHYRA